MIKNNHHDKSYKIVLSKKKNFMTFLRQFIKKNWVKNIDPDSLELCDKGFVDPFFDELESDIIYKVKIQEVDVYFYVLLELQSFVDQTMPFRIFYYMAAIWKRVFNDVMKNEREKVGFKMPIIIPVVFYNGSNGWTPKQRFSEYQEGVEFFDSEFVTDFKYILVDIKDSTPEELFANLNAVSAIIVADKARSSVEELTATIEKVLKNPVWKSDTEGLDDFLFWVVNALKRTSLDDDRIKEFIESVKKGEPDMEKVSIDYIVERYKAEGKAEGRAEGEAEGEARGELKGKISVYFTEMNLTIQQIAEKLGIGEKDVKATLDELQLA